MRENIASLFRCPLTGEKLNLKVIKKYNHPITKAEEIFSGYFWSDKGGCYPIINGIPRMLPESLLVYSKELTEWWKEFPIQKVKIYNSYGDFINHSALQNKKIQSTFGFEWNLLRRNKELKIWDLNKNEFSEKLLKELQLSPNYNCNLTLDAGCGHGRSARIMTSFSKTVIGAEVSPAVELAYEENDNPDCHFIQADVHYLPFEQAAFDLVYCSGVLHHNVSTEAALKQISTLVKYGGILSIWLYHPFKNKLHTFMRCYRVVTKRLPVQVIYYLNVFTITPAQWLISRITGKKKKWVEVAIEQLDMLTPAFRHEHTHDEVKKWILENNFHNPIITDVDNYGFSIKAKKNNYF